MQKNLDFQTKMIKNLSDEAELGPKPAIFSSEMAILLSDTLFDSSNGDADSPLG